MADEVAAPSAVEASPAAEVSPDAGLGASEATEQKPSKADLAYAKLQSHLDRERQAREKAEDHAMRLMQLVGESQTRSDMAELERNAPDPLTHPVEAAAYWKKVHFDGEEARRLEQEQQAQRHANREATDRYISSYLAKVAIETGVEIDEKDERLVLVQNRQDLFEKSVQTIVKEATKLREAQAEREAEIERRVQEKLREAGVDRFDGGGPNAVGATGALTWESWEAMSPMERRQLRHTDPDKVRDMERRRFARSA